MTPVHDVTIIPLNFSSEVTEVPLGKDFSLRHHLSSVQDKLNLLISWCAFEVLFHIWWLDNIGGIISDEEARFINLNDDVEKDATAVGNPVASTAVRSLSRHLQKYTHFLSTSSSFQGRATECLP